MRRALLGLLLGLASGPALALAGPPTPGTSFTIPESVELRMIWIEPGTFWLRDPLTGDDDTEVTLTHGYWLGRTEVTQAQWAAVMAHHPIFQSDPRPSRFKGADRPVEQVTWDKAMAFCTTLNAYERSAGRLPAGYEYTLPTEAQWEYAARAGAAGKYIGDLDATTWYKANSGETSHPVAQKQPNAWGLYDMQGNVAEWCWDWFAAYPGGHITDPSGPTSGVYRTQRGSSTASSAGYCHLSQRWRNVPFTKNRYTGLRLALVPVRATGTPAVVAPTTNP